MKIALIVRPPADPARAAPLQSLVRELRRSGHVVRPRLTFEHHDALHFARGAARRGYDLVIAAGGDGTINEVVNGLTAVESPTRLAILPLGTANDFAKGLCIPEDLEAALDVALHGAVLDVDVAQVNDRRFINVSTGGFGANASQSGRSAKRRLGKLAYVIDGAKELMDMHPEVARFSAGERVVYEGEFTFFAVGNARRTGGGNPLTPRADFTDSKLDVVIVCGLSRLDFLTLLPEIRAGKHLDNADVLYEQVALLRVEAREPIRVNADGEPLRAASFDYRILERPIAVMVPR